MKLIKKLLTFYRVTIILSIRFAKFIDYQSKPQIIKV